MTNLWRALLLLVAVPMLMIFATVSAWAADCGDTTGPGGTDVPCSCGDTVTTDTVLKASDPVVNNGCDSIGLNVAGGVQLDGHLLKIECVGPLSIGLFLVGDSIEISRSRIRGCTDGIFGNTSGSLIENVDAGHGVGTAFQIAGSNNTLRHNLCHDSGGVGIVILGGNNTLERNYCHHNGDSGIFVFGSNNQLNTNVATHNGFRGIEAGGPNLTNGRNFGSRNGFDPQCEIDGSSGNLC